MPQPKHLEPGAYAADGGAVGVLLVHGYTGSVVEMRPMAEYLAEKGLTVRCPLLPGHGTNPQELTRIRWQEWGDEVEAQFDHLNELCGTVFVGGLSLGSLLSLWLGSRHPEIAGLIAMAPAIEFRNRLAPLALGLRHVLKYDPFRSLVDDDLVDPEGIERNWCYDELPLWGVGEVFLLRRLVAKALPMIRQPLLVFQGRQDAQLTAGAAQTVYDGVASTDKTLVWLEHSGHNLLVDGEREAVWAQSYNWIVDRVGT
jgi:carboxylesterase